MMHFPRRGAGPGGQGCVSPQRPPGAGPPHRARPARSPRGPRSPARLPAPGGRYSGAEGPIPARPRTRAAQGAPRPSGKSNSPRLLRKHPAQARPSVPPSLRPRPQAALPALRPRRDRRALTHHTGSAPGKPRQREWETSKLRPESAGCVFGAWVRNTAIASKQL